MWIVLKRISIVRRYSQIPAPTDRQAVTGPSAVCSSEDVAETPTDSPASAVASVSEVFD